MYIRADSEKLLFFFASKAYTVSQNRYINSPLLGYAAPTLPKHCPKTCPPVVVMDTYKDTNIKKGSNHAQMDVHRSTAQD